MLKRKETSAKAAKLRALESGNTATGSRYDRKNARTKTRSS